MNQDVFDRVKRDRRFQELVAKRTRFAWLLSAAMLVIYFGFIFIIAFAPKSLGTPIGSGVTTIGIPIGLFVIVSAFVLTGIYVRRANTEFDAITRQIIEGAKGWSRFAFSQCSGDGKPLDVRWFSGVVGQGLQTRWRRRPHVSRSARYGGDTTRARRMYRSRDRHHHRPVTE